MSEFVYSRDTWFAPLPIDSTNNVLVFTDSSITDEVITLPLTVASNPVAYLNKDVFTTGVGGSYSGVLNEIRSQINAASSNAYEWQEYTPSGYPAAMGIKLVQTTGSGAFSWNFTNGSFTFNARILGYGTASPSSDDTSSGGELAGPYSTYGTWVSHTIDGGEATDKLPIPNKRIVLSGDDVKYADRKQYHKRTYRRMRYDWVPGAHVRKNRGLDLDSANTGSIAEGDTNNAFEDIWDLATRGASAGGSVAGVEVGNLAHMEIHHDDVDVLGKTTTADEVLRLSDESQIEDFTECITLQRMAGEYYTVEIEGLILFGSYGQ